MNAARKWLRTAASTIAAILRELADENAYERHLRVHGRAHSPQEWRRFTDERFRTKYARPKCC